MSLFDDRLYTTTEVAEYLRKDRHYIQYVREEGLLKGMKHGRGYLYRESEVKKFMQIVEDYQLDLSSHDKIILAGIQMKNGTLSNAVSQSVHP